MKYSITEVFTSIQGEGLHSGSMCNFVRLYGCNLDCPWCDTKITNIESLSIDEIISKLNHSLPTVITGGEPTIQDNVVDLIKGLKARGFFKIHMESNGTCEDEEKYMYVDFLTISPKWKNDNFVVSKQALKYCCELKIVVSMDYLNPEGTIHHHILERMSYLCKAINYESYRKKYLFLQPEYYNYQKSLDSILNLMHNKPELGFRLSLQLHKILGVK